VCRDITTDRLNCGLCGRACAAGQICSGSTCILSCPAGQVACGGACVNGASLTCGARIDLGTLSAGASTSTDIRQLPSSGQEDWFLVRFPLNADFRQHGTGTPSISFAQNDGNLFRFDVVAACGSGGMPCGSGGAAGGLTSWSYVDNCNLGRLTDCSTRASTWPATALVRVFRISSGTDCSRYRLALSR
jgi:hypothetical protein